MICAECGADFIATEKQERQAGRYKSNYCPTCWDKVRKSKLNLGPFYISRRRLIRERHIRLKAIDAFSRLEQLPNLNAVSLIEVRRMMKMAAGVNLKRNSRIVKDNKIIKDVAVERGWLYRFSNKYGWFENVKKEL